MSGTEEISEKILNYLKNNFKAPDDMDEEAISEWWGGIQEIGESLDDITLGIEDLLAAGAIKKQELVNDIFYYEVI